MKQGNIFIANFVPIVAGMEGCERTDFHAGWKIFDDL
jgi:hypothetical protein